MSLPRLMRVHDSHEIYTFELHIKNKVIAISNILGGLHAYLLKHKMPYIHTDNDNTTNYTVLWHKWCETEIDKSVIEDGLLTKEEAEELIKFDKYIWSNPIMCGFIFSIYKPMDCVTYGSIVVDYTPLVHITCGTKNEVKLYCKEATLVNDTLINPPIIKSYKDRKLAALKGKLEANPDYYFSLTNRELVDNFHENYLPIQTNGEKIV